MATRVHLILLPVLCAILAEGLAKDSNSADVDHHDHSSEESPKNGPINGDIFSYNTNYKTRHFFNDPKGRYPYHQASNNYGYPNRFGGSGFGGLSGFPFMGSLNNFIPNLFGSNNGVYPMGFNRPGPSSKYSEEEYSNEKYDTNHKHPAHSHSHKPMSGEELDKHENNSKEDQKPALSDQKLEAVPPKTNVDKKDDSPAKENHSEEENGNAEGDHKDKVDLSANKDYLLVSSDGNGNNVFLLHENAPSGFIQAYPPQVNTPLTHNKLDSNNYNNAVQGDPNYVLVYANGQLIKIPGVTVNQPLNFQNGYQNPNMVVPNAVSNNGQNIPVIPYPVANNAQNVPFVPNNGQNVQFVANPVPNNGQNVQFVANPVPNNGQNVQYVPNTIPNNGQNVQFVANPVPNNGQNVQFVPNTVPNNGQNVQFVPNPVPNNGQNVQFVPNPIPNNAQTVPYVPNPTPNNGQNVPFVPNPVPNNGQNVQYVPNPIPNNAQNVPFVPNPAPNNGQNVQYVPNPTPNSAQNVPFVSNPNANVPNQGNPIYVQIPNNVGPASNAAPNPNYVIQNQPLPYQNNNNPYGNNQPNLVSQPFQNNGYVQPNVIPNNNQGTFSNGQNPSQGSPAITSTLNNQNVYQPLPTLQKEAEPVTPVGNAEPVTAPSIQAPDSSVNDLVGDLSNDLGAKPALMVSGFKESDADKKDQENKDEGVEKSEEKKEETNEA